jgi:hypothetical protein
MSKDHVSWACGQPPGLLVLLKAHSPGVLAYKGITLNIPPALS